MSTDACPKWNSFQDRLQGSFGWEGQKCTEKDIGFRAMFKERQSHTLSSKSCHQASVYFS
jgi:hypothetical protein